MGLLNSALQIGRSALLSYEGALQVVGSNIASAGAPDYTRLSPRLDPLHSPPISGQVQPGAGVALTEIKRNIDEALESRIRLAIGDEASAVAREGTLVQMEALFDDLNQAGLGIRLTEFFNAFDELQNTPEDLAVRDLVVGSGLSLAESIRNLRVQLSSLSEAVDARMVGLADSADAIARGIAELNREITGAEAGRTAEATGLRDQRDGLLRQLAEIFDVTVREQSDGTVNVYVGSESLVQGGTVRGLIAVEEPDGEASRTSIRFADSSQQISVRGGALDGLIAARDQDAQIAALDRLAGAIIADVNRIHADGQGLVGFTAVTGAYDALAADVALDDPAAGLPVHPDNGSFYITVIDDATGTPVAHRIDVTLDGTSAGTTLESLASDISEQVVGVTATVTTDNRLRFQADSGVSFAFGYDGQDGRADTSGVLAALGINTFFSGTDARNIRVNETLQQQPSLLAAASMFLAGDGSVAARVASAGTLNSDRLGGVSISEFYRGMANAVARATASARDEVDATVSILTSLQTQRESISGVNLDEEAIALLKFERAFQAASRFVSVVDGLIEQLVSLIR